MAYYRRIENNGRNDGYNFREEKRGWEEEKEWDDEKEMEDEYEYDGRDKCKKYPKKPCFSDEKKCKFEFPLKVIVKVVPIDDHHDKKYYD